MSLLDKIGVVGVSCGLCCHDDLPCDKCLKNTLKSNGLPDKYLSQVKGLSKTRRGSCYPWDNSELCWKLEELIAEYKKELENGTTEQT